MYHSPPEECPMRATHLIPIAVLAFAVACTESTTAPTPESPSFRAPTSGTHFQDASADFTNSTDNTLTANFDIAGLGTAANTVTVRASANASALYACQNGGGNFPTDPKKKQSNAIVSAQGDFAADNGRATGSLLLSPPASTLRCPGGQVAVLVSVTYTNVQINVVGTNVTATSNNSDIETSYSRTFFTI
jgi:hypothetical protein